MRLTQIIEALLFASDAPLSAADLARVDERLDEDTVAAVIEELRAEYDAAERSFSVYEVAGGYQLLTRPEFVAVLERYETVPQPARLSSPSLEVLAIVAYRQPIGRAEIEEIRGVTSTGPLKTLQDRHLVEAVGRAEGLGRPLLYGTTSKFLEHFGFRSLEDLPRPDELPVVLRARSAQTDTVADTEQTDTARTDTEPTGDRTGGAVEAGRLGESVEAIEERLDDESAVIAADAVATDPEAETYVAEAEATLAEAAATEDVAGELAEAESTSLAAIALDTSDDAAAEALEIEVLSVAEEAEADGADRGS